MHIAARHRVPVCTGMQILAVLCQAKEMVAGRAEQRTHFRQIILSWLNFLARICRDGSMIPPRRRITRCRVESAGAGSEWSNKAMPATQQLPNKEHVQTVTEAFHSPLSTEHCDNVNSSSSCFPEKISR